MKGLVFLLIGFWATAVIEQQYKLAQGYSISFTNADVSGTFDELSSTSLFFDPVKLTNSKLSFKIEVASINTGNGLQNKHARGEE